MAEESKQSTSGTWWVTEPSAIAPERPSNLRPGEKEDPRGTVIDVFHNTVRRHGDKPALSWKPGQDVNAEWESYTWAEYYNHCVRFAKSLIQIGFKPFSSVNIMGFNHQNWLIADVGCILAGGLAAGIYTTNKPEATAYIADHSDAEVAVVEDAAQLAKWLEIAGSLPKLKAIVLYREDLPDADIAAHNNNEDNRVKLFNWEDFMALGRDTPNSVLEERMSNQKPGHCCTLIYTSGTTGPPKAVMISHDNLVWTAGHVLCNLFEVSERDHILSYLPLSHIAAQMLDVHSPMLSGCRTYFVSPKALKGELGAWLKAVRPTIFFGVPRVWEKIKDKIVAGARANPATGAKAKIVAWAKGVGTQYTDNIQYGNSGEHPCCFGLAYKLVFSKIREALGLTRCRVAATGAAPITREVLNFFAALNVPIYEVFGQSECTGPQTVNYPSPTGHAGVFRLGTAGPGVPGSFMMIVPETQELIYKGRHIMMGYMKNPEKTRDTIDEDGWLHSGDQGEIDADGFLRITGRIKELIITAGGENVAPVILENNMKKANPALSNCVVIGEKKKFLIMFVTLKTTVDSNMEPTNILDGDAVVVGKAIGSSATTVEQAAADPKWQKYITDKMIEANDNAPSNAQTIKKWRMLVKDFSIGGGELTPTQKLKRSVVNSMYEELIDEAYAPGSANVGSNATGATGTGAATAAVAAAEPAAAPVAAPAAAAAEPAKPADAADVQISTTEA